MAYDGSLKFDTKIDSSGFDKGLSMLKKAAAGLSLAKLTDEIIDVGATFEASMSQVAAISMATEEEFEALSAAAKEMGATTKYTAAEAADGLQYLSLAGYTAAESIEALPKVLRLAQAGGMDLAYASDLLTDSMAVMGLGIKDMDNFSDQLAMAASKSNTSVAQLGEAVLVAGGQAKLAAMSTEEMNTALGILADNGIKGSEGGTALRNTLKNLYTPTSQSAKVMKNLGISTADAEGNLRDAQDVLKDLKKSLDGMSESKRIETMGDIFDTRTIAAASALLENCGERWDELEGYLSECDGAAKRMADTMNDNLRGRVDEMSSAAEALGITIFEKAAPGLKALAETATTTISAVDSFLQDGGLDIISNVAPMLLAGAAGYMTYTGAIKLAAMAQAAFNAVSMTNPVGLMVAAIGALTGAAIACDVALNGTTRAIKKERQEYEDAKRAVNEDAQAKAQQIERAQTLADELYRLVDANGRVRAGYEDRVKYILGELSAATGQEIQIVDGVIQKYGELKDELNDVLKQKEAAALVEGVNENYNAAVASIEEYRQKTIDLRGELDLLLDKYKDEIATTGMIPQVVIAATAAYQESEKQYAQCTEDKIKYGEMLEQFELGNYEEFKKLYRSYNGIMQGNAATALTTFQQKRDTYEKEKDILMSLLQRAEAAGNTQLAEEFKNQLATIDAELGKLETSITDELRTIAQTSLTEAKAIGVNISSGIVVGMQQGAWQVNSAGASLVRAAFTGATDAAVIRSPSHVFRDQVGYMMSLGVAYGVEDGIPVAVQSMEKLCAGLVGEAKDAAERQEKLQQRVLQSLKNSFDLGLITEEQYYEQLTKLRDSYFAAGSEEWEKYTLEILKYNIDAAEEQRNALKKIYDDIAYNITDKLDEIGDAQTSLADSLKSMASGVSTITYKGLGADGSDIVDTVLDVNGLRKANDTKEAFQNAALAAKDRIKTALGEENKELTAQIYDTIRTMGADEGLAFANAILNANDDTFSEWIAQQIRGAGLNDGVAQSLYAEDMQNMGEHLIGELYSAWDAELEKQFGQLPGDFWDIGAEAANGFYEGFLNDINAYMAELERQITTRIASFAPMIEGVGGYGGTITSTTYSPSYTINAPSGDAQSITNSIKNYETAKKMTGGY